MSDREYTTTWVKPMLYEYQVRMLAERIQIGQEVVAELYKAWEGDMSSMGRGKTYLETVTIEKKYPYIALTDKGAIQWVEVALHNPHLIRKMERGYEHSSSDRQINKGSRTERSEDNGHTFHDCR